MKRLKIALGVFLVSVFFTFSATAQGIYQKGTIQISKKKSIDAYVSIDYTFPQRFQNSLTYITPDSYAKYQETGKLKGKKKIDLKLKDFIGFTLDNGQTFEVVKYVDLSKKGMGMLPQRKCLEQIADGKIKAYKLYSRTTGKMPRELVNVVMDSRMKGDAMLIDYIQNNFQILLLKDTKNPKNINHINLLNYIGDNEIVQTNYSNNEYGFRDQFTERQKYGVYVNKKYEAALLKMLSHYNGESDYTTGN
tara:strand:- start:298671 stop:299417 length:747 start_codon:yes stop_codon:yes gene_type:complete